MKEEAIYRELGKLPVTLRAEIRKETEQLNSAIGWKQSTERNQEAAKK